MIRLQPMVALHPEMGLNSQPSGAKTKSMTQAKAKKSYPHEYLQTQKSLHR
jgi:hypothetical protein